MGTGNVAQGINATHQRQSEGERNADASKAGSCKGRCPAPSDYKPSGPKGLGGAFAFQIHRGG